MFALQFELFVLGSMNRVNQKYLRRVLRLGHSI